MKKILALAGVLAVVLFASCKPGQKESGQPAEGDASAVNAPAAGSIVYFQLDTLLHQYDMANEKMDAFNSKAKGIENEITRRGNKLQADFNSFQEKYSKGLLLPSVAEQENQKLMRRKEEFDRYAAKQQQDLATEQQVIMNQISDAINSALKEYNEEKQYAMILSSSSAAPLTYLQAPVTVGDPSLDITADLVRVLNDAYVKTKNQKD